MKDIKEAIQASIATDSIIHVTVNAADIYEAMEGVGYDDAIEVDGAYDVWGEANGQEWRLNVTVNA